MKTIATMKSALIALLAFCLCLPLVGDDAVKKLFEETKANAEKGNAVAQHNLGYMYAAGKGVPQDYVAAYAWFNIAAANGDATAKKNKPIIASILTPEQIAKAEVLAKEMIKKYPKLLK